MKKCIWKTEVDFEIPLCTVCTIILTSVFLVKLIRIFTESWILFLSTRTPDCFQIFCSRAQTQGFFFHVFFSPISDLARYTVYTVYSNSSNLCQRWFLLGWLQCHIHLNIFEYPNAMLTVLLTVVVKAFRDIVILCSKNLLNPSKSARDRCHCDSL